MKKIILLIHPFFQRKCKQDNNVALLPCQEIYDASKTGNKFNENHGAFSGVQWSSEIPTNEQLGLMGITDENGNYIINNVRYEGRRYA